MSFPSNDLCNLTMRKYSQISWSRLSVDQQDETMFCIFKLHQSKCDNTTCGKLLREFSRVPWNKIDVLTRQTIHDCISKMIHTRYLQKILPRIPGDFMTNPMKKWHMLYEARYLIALGVQLFLDNHLKLSSLHSSFYQSLVTSFDLNGTHYSRLLSEKERDCFIEKTSFIDYLNWNNIEIPEFMNSTYKDLNNASFFVSKCWMIMKIYFGFILDLVKDFIK
jgi:hypothetical protein